jgi:hypothetical protein
MTPSVSRAVTRTEEKTYQFLKTARRKGKWDATQLRGSSGVGRAAQAAKFPRAPSKMLS